MMGVILRSSNLAVGFLFLILLSACQDRHEREEEERKRRLQLYVFVSRCTAYPFNAKQPTDNPKRQLKVNKQQLESLQQKFQVKLTSKMAVTNFFFFKFCLVLIDGKNCRKFL